MYLEEYRLGQIWEIPPVLITKEMIVEFARAYDPLPIHIDEEYAQGTRFGGLIASGPQSFMLLWSEFVKRHDPLGDQLVAGLSNHMSWPAPTYAGDRLRGEVEVVAIEPKNRHNGVLKVELRGYNQHDEPVVKGGADIYMQRRTENEA